MHNRRCVWQRREKEEMGDRTPHHDPSLNNNRNKKNDRHMHYHMLQKYQTSTPSAALSFAKKTKHNRLPTQEKLQGAKLYTVLFFFCHSVCNLDTSSTLEKIADPGSHINDI